MGIYKWHASVIKEGERILRNFLWSGEPDSKKACVMAWGKVCKPLKEGGIKLRRLKEINQSLMMKLTWNFLNPKDEWSEFMRAKFIATSGSFSTITKGSSIRAVVKGALEDIHAHSGWVIRDGACIDLWRDNWCSPLSLKDMINDDGIPWTDLHAMVGCISRWSVPNNLQLFSYRFGVDIHDIKINKNKIDRRVWKPDLVGNFSVKGTFDSIRNKGQPIWWVLERNLKSLLEVGDTMSPYLKDLWIGAIWGETNLIWHVRNKKIFEEQIYTLDKEKRKWNKQIHGNAFLFNGYMLNSQSDLGILHSLGVPLHPSNHIVVKSCFGELPQQGEIKINTDRAARGNPGKKGICCIFRDNDGKVLGTLSKGLGMVTKYTAECKTIIQGVESAASNGWLITWVESDSKSAVEAFNSDNIPWVLEADRKNAKWNMKLIRISANWRKANFSVDDLSKWGANLQDGLCETGMGRLAFLKKWKYLCKNILDSVSFSLFTLFNRAIASLL
ncbi:hypothetical protein GIB67_000010 [Kingdonia uniflora]|uniref:RNase H type-1 domain-containing protein n=1 Tax=Kingdonia uniflora TaxID=39325 RepID=A0A7J7MNL3_9MAGN|nr:hypothetical protein GIB67_000010 [Kingdonia uniflora]